MWFTFQEINETGAMCGKKKQQIVLKNINYNPDESVTEPPSAVRKHARRLLSIDESGRKSL